METYLCQHKEFNTDDMELVTEILLRSSQYNARILHKKALDMVAWDLDKAKKTEAYDVIKKNHPDIIRDIADALHDRLSGAVKRARKRKHEF